MGAMMSGTMGAPFTGLAFMVEATSDVRLLPGLLVGLITRGDLVRALEREGSEDETVLDAGSKRLVVAYPDELLEEATAKMLEHEIGRLPVVRRDDPGQLVGFLERAGVMAVLLQATREERVRDPGWLSARLQFLRTQGARVLARG